MKRQLQLLQGQLQPGTLGLFQPNRGSLVRPHSSFTLILPFSAISACFLPVSGLSVLISQSVSHTNSLTQLY